MITSDLDRSLKQTAARPDVKRETDYYLSRIGNIKSLDDFLKDDRVYTYAMRAYGLEDMTYAKAFMRKVLTEGIDRNDSFANRLADGRYREFVQVFNFARYGGTATAFSRTQQGTADRYVRQSLELQAGATNEGLRLALYFQRKAPSATNAFSLLADRALLKVTQVALGIPAATGTLDIEKQAALITKKLDVAGLKEPEKLDRLLQRFTALWDIENPPTNSTAAPNALLSGSSNIFDNDLLTKVQNLRTGR